MKETEKYDSKLYKPNKPYHKMSIEELIGHCKICKSLDKMPYNKIKKLENLSDDVLQKKIEIFLERNNGKKHYEKKYTKKNNNKINTRKKNNNKINTRKENNNKINTRKENKKENKKNKTKKQFEKKNKTKKTNI